MHVSAVVISGFQSTRGTTADLVISEVSDTVSIHARLDGEVAVGHRSVADVSIHACGARLNLIVVVDVAIVVSIHAPAI